MTDPEQNSSSATATLAIGPALGNPVVSSPSLIVAQGGRDTDRHRGAKRPELRSIAADHHGGDASSNGTVTLADGTTAVHAGQTLSVAQLTGLEFKPATGTPQTASAFAYTVKDPTGNISTGTATVTIQPTPFGDLTVSGTVTPILVSGEALFAGGVTVNVFVDPRSGAGVSFFANHQSFVLGSESYYLVGQATVQLDEFGNPVSIDFGPTVNQGGPFFQGAVTSADFSLSAELPTGSYDIALRATMVTQFGGTSTSFGRSG